MMFLIRAAFWLAIVVLLLPTDSKQQADVYGTAQAAVKDMSMFCDRNPDACVKGKEVLAVFVQKAEFGFQMLMDFIENKTTADSAVEPNGASMPAAPQDAAWSAGTLEPGDLEPDWNGPSGT
jgi:hypothetical protein